MRTKTQQSSVDSAFGIMNASQTAGMIWLFGHEGDGNKKGNCIPHVEAHSSLEPRQHFRAQLLVLSEPGSCGAYLQCIWVECSCRQDFRWAAQGQAWCDG